MNDRDIGPAFLIWPLGAVLLLLLLQFPHTAPKGANAPLVGNRSCWEPRLVTALRFKRKASKIIEDGHQKVRMAVGFRSALLYL